MNSQDRRHTLPEADVVTQGGANLERCIAPPAHLIRSRGSDAE